MVSVTLDLVLTELKKVEDIRVNPIISDFFISPHFYKGFNDEKIHKECRALLSHIIQKMRVSSGVNFDLFVGDKVAIVSGISEGFLGKSFSLGNSKPIPLDLILGELEIMGYQKIIFDVDSLVKVNPHFLKPTSSVVLYQTNSNQFYSLGEVEVLK